MQRLTLLTGGLISSAFILAACAHDQMTSGTAAAEATQTSTVYLAMTSIYQPHFQGVADTAFYAYNDDGELDASLLTDEQWATMKASAQVLRDTSLHFAAEDTIRVAEPGEQLFNEGKGFIESKAVQAVIDTDPDGFRAMMSVMANEATGAMEAIEARDAEALSVSSDRLYAACKSCHVMYWYPGRQ